MNIEDSNVRLTVCISLHDLQGDCIPISIGAHSSQGYVDIVDISNQEIEALMYGMSQFATLLEEQHRRNQEIEDQLSQLGLRPR